MPWNYALRFRKGVEEWATCLSVGVVVVVVVIAMVGEAAAGGGGERGRGSRGGRGDSLRNGLIHASIQSHLSPPKVLFDGCLLLMLLLLLLLLRPLLPLRGCQVLYDGCLLLMRDSENFGKLFRGLNESRLEVGGEV